MYKNYKKNPPQTATFHPTQTNKKPLPTNQKNKPHQTQGIETRSWCIRKDFRDVNNRKLNYTMRRYSVQEGLFSQTCIFIFHVKWKEKEFFCDYSLPSFYVVVVHLQKRNSRSTNWQKKYTCV